MEYRMLKKMKYRMLLNNENKRLKCFFKFNHFNCHHTVLSKHPFYY